MKSLFSGDAFAVIHIINFHSYLSYRIFMTMASLMQSVIVGWQVYELSHNVLWLGFIGLVEVIPQVSISLFAGHYIDLYNRRKIVNYTTLLLILGSLILLIYSANVGYYSAKYGTLPIFITIFFTGFARGILNPANVALMGQLIPRNLYANAAIWNSASWQVAAVMGPAIGGLVYGYWGIVPAYSLVFALYTLSF